MPQPGWSDKREGSRRWRAMMQPQVISPTEPPPTRPLPDLPDEPQPTPRPADPPSASLSPWRIEDWVPASG